MKPDTQSKYLKDIWAYQQSGLAYDPALRFPAGLILRWYAVSIDYAFFLPFYLVFRNPLERNLELLSVAPGSFRSILIPAFVFAIPWTLYFLLPTFLWGKTLGKSVVGLRVASNHGEMHFFQVLMRESVGKVLSLSLFLAGVLMAIVHPQKKMLHDILTHTTVLRVPTPNDPPK